MLGRPWDMRPICALWVVVRAVGIVNLPMVQIPVGILILATDGYSVHITFGRMGTGWCFAIRAMNSHPNDISGFAISPLVLDADLSSTIRIGGKGVRLLASGGTMSNGLDFPIFQPPPS